MGPLNQRGRPVVGGEAKSVEIKIRIEPYLCKQMNNACRRLGMTRAAFVRYAIEQLIRSLKLNNYY